jgi:hydroxymethylpyrimidine/phosphomethylpyrimidine kinase
MTYKRVLTIAGSDSGGGAGIQADLKTFSALGCYGMSVITALTAQNTVAVTAIHEVPIKMIRQQLEAVLDDIGVDAIKIGMLQTPEVISEVAAVIRQYELKKIVLDPVMVAKSGDKLLHDDAVASLKYNLLPLAMVVTPNLPEAAVLIGESVKSFAEMEKAGNVLLEHGPHSVLIKGGHSEDSMSADCLIQPGKPPEWFNSERINTKNTHGTGCTLSSAISSFLARDLPIREAIASAKEYISSAIQAGADYSLGAGHGPVHHFHKFWK